MSDTKASPAPWRWGWADTDGDVVADDALHDGNQEQMGFYDESGRRGQDFHEVNRRLIALSPTMASMLESLEWVSHTTVGIEYNETTPLFCPCCGEEKDYGHQQNDEYRKQCKLAAILSELRKP